MDVNACNYDSSANTSDIESCQYAQQLRLFKRLFITDNGICVARGYGCTNYDSITMIHQLQK